MMKRNPYFNQSHYPDPTAFYGTKEIVKEENEIESKIRTLMHIFRYIANLAGFEIVNRVHFKHKETGRKYE